VVRLGRINRPCLTLAKGSRLAACLRCCAVRSDRPTSAAMAAVVLGGGDNLSPPVLCDWFRGTFRTVLAGVAGVAGHLCNGCNGCQETPGALGLPGVAGQLQRPATVATVGGGVAALQVLQVLQPLQVLHKSRLSLSLSLSLSPLHLNTPPGEGISVPCRGY